MSAYKLRDRNEAADFRLAWTKALEPGLAAQRRRSPRALPRLKRLDRRRKADNVDEMHGPPNSLAAAPSTSSALATLQALLDRLRAQDKESRGHCGEPRS